MSWRADFLEARDGRQRELDRLLGQSTPEAAASFLLIGANVPGCDKHRPGIARLLRGALDSLERSIGLKVLLSPKGSAWVLPYRVFQPATHRGQKSRCGASRPKAPPRACWMWMSTVQTVPRWTGPVWGFRRDPALYVPSRRVSASCCGAIPTRNSWNEWIRCCGLLCRPRAVFSLNYSPPTCG